MHAIPFPPLPADTERAIKSVFHIENLYLAIGDQLGSLFSDVDWADLDPYGDRPPSVLFVLAMVTAFQFAEELPDRRAADAVRQRMDWKYALHLPLNYPGLNDRELGEFRRRLRDNSVGQETFGRVLARLASVGLLGNGRKRQAQVIEVLAAVDMLGQVEQMAESMRLALEELAARNPEWLQANRLPHWHGRYGQPQVAIHLPRSGEEQSEMLDKFRADISHLLEAIARADSPELALLPEVQALQRLLTQESEPELRNTD